MPDELGFNEYARLAMRTAAGASVESLDASLLNAGLGFAGESGEFNDILKKCLFHGHLLTEETKAKLRDEVGDILWYCALAARGLETDLDSIAKGNIEKLRLRYPEGFDSHRS